jgi:hypothetical protein
VHQRSPVNIPDLYNRPKLPSLLALCQLLAESRTVNGHLVNGLWDQKDLWKQLIDLNGIEIILKRLLKVAVLDFNTQTKAISNIDNSKRNWHDNNLDHSSTSYTGGPPKTTAKTTAKYSFNASLLFDDLGCKLTDLRGRDCSQADPRG